MMGNIFAFFVEYFDNLKIPHLKASEQARYSFRLRLHSKSLILLVISFAIISCGQKDTSWVVRIKNIRVPTREFLVKFKESNQYRNNSSFTPEVLKEYAEHTFVPALLFTVEGYQLGIDKKPSVRAAIHKREIQIIGQKNGRLFRQIIPPNLSIDNSDLETELRKRGILAGSKDINDLSPQLVDSLKTELIDRKRKKLIGQYTQTLYRKFHFRVAREGANLMIKITNTPRKEFKQLASQFDPRKVVLLQYADVSLSVNDVLFSFPEDFQFRRKKFANYEQVEQYLMEKFLPELLFLDAKERGLLDDPDVKYLIEKSKRRIVAAECEKELTVHGIRVSQEEVEARYEQEREKYQNISPKRAKYEIRIRLIAEKRNERYWNTRKKLRAKYHVIFNKAAFKHLARVLNEEKL